MIKCANQSISANEDDILRYILSPTGRPGLGLRGHGPRPAVPLDIHHRFDRGHVRNTLRSTVPLRRHQTH